MALFSADVDDARTQAERAAAEHQNLVSRLQKLSKDRDTIYSKVESGALELLDAVMETKDAVVPKLLRLQAQQRPATAAAVAAPQPRSEPGANSDALVRSLEDQLDQASRTIKELQGQLSSSESHHRALTRSHASELALAASRHERELAELRQTLKSETSELHASKVRGASAQEETLEVLRAARGAALREADAARAEVARLQGQLDGARSETDRQKSAGVQAETNAQAEQLRTVAGTEARSRLEGELRKAEQARRRAQDEAQEERRAKVKAADEAKELDQALGRAREQLATAQAGNKRLVGELEALAAATKPQAAQAAQAAGQTAG